ncbi:MAG: hypothetical protein ACI8Z9_001446 [Paraglaciecola sp.]|jgi:hypothetical protein
MFNKMFMKKVTVGLIACGASLFSALSQGAVIAIADFDAQVELGVSSTFLSSEFTTELCCNDVSVYGSASGDASGSGDADPLSLAAGEFGELSASANGEVTGLHSVVESFWATSAYLFIDNTTNSDITGDVKFDITWSASIFTGGLHSEAFSGAYLYIDNSYGDIIFDDYIEFDSLWDGPGAFGATQMFNVNLRDVIIDAGDFEEYYIEIAAYGFAAVPEPSGVFLAGLALLFAVRKRKMS